MDENEIAKVVVDVAFQIHSKLGPGLLESVYQTIMLYELHKRGLRAEKEVPIPVTWENMQIDLGFRADLIVEHKLIIELKSIDSISQVHKKQLHTYLKVTDIRLGLLINFGSELIKDGITRIANKLPEAPKT